MSATWLTEEGVRTRLRAACKQCGSQQFWARAHGVSDSYVSDVLTGRREPGDAILRGLGLVRFVRYRRAAP